MFTSPAVITEIDFNQDHSTDVQQPLGQATLLVRGSEVYWLNNGTRQELQSGDSVEIHARSVVVVKQKANEQERNPILEVSVQFQCDDRTIVTLLRGRKKLRVDSCRRSELLAELVGRRLQDRANQKAPSEEGWVDKLRLSKSLDVSPPYINTLLSRLRLLCPPLGLMPGSLLVETRSAKPGAKSRTEEVRIASCHVRSK